MDIKKHGWRWPILGWLALVCLLPVATAEAQPDTLRLATGSMGGTFLPVGGDLAAWWSKVIPHLVVIPEISAGSVDNLDRLISGTADIAIVGSSPFREVLNGWGTLSEDAKSICSLGTLYIDAEQFVVRTSLVRVGNLLDLNGLLMYPGPHQSGGEIDTRLILSVLDIEPQFVYVDERDKSYSAAAKALIRGDFDAATFSGGVPIQAVTELFLTRPGEFEILPFSRHMLNKLKYYEQDFDGVVILKSSYPGMTDDIQTVGGPNLLVAAPHIDTDILVALADAVNAGIQEPGKGLRSELSHPVLQALEPVLWRLDPVKASCLDPKIADVGSAKSDASTPQ